MKNATLTMVVSDLQLQKFADLIYGRAGIRISPQKKTLLSNRLRRRLKVTGLESFDEYYKLLKRISPNDAEWDGFLQEITTHETFLFRDAVQWSWFSDEYLPAIADEAAAGKRRKELRIWSAACSTGDEAFTIASCIADRIPNASTWKVEIVGTDIGVGAVQQAQEAQFGPRAMRNVPQSYRQRFFKPLAEDRWEAKELLKQMTTFKHHNLLDPLPGPKFDLVVIKNVLIYFDAESKQHAFRNLADKMPTNGLLVVGPAEGISDLLADYDRQKTWLYRKPAGK